MKSNPVSKNFSDIFVHQFPPSPLCSRGKLHHETAYTQSESVWFLQSWNVFWHASPRQHKSLESLSYQESSTTAKLTLFCVVGKLIFCVTQQIAIRWPSDLWFLAWQKIGLTHWPCNYNLVVQLIRLLINSTKGYYLFVKLEQKIWRCTCRFSGQKLFVNCP